MKRILFFVFALGIAFSVPAAAQFNGFGNNLVLLDPPGRVFPGKYFEYKAQFYLHKHDYRMALDMFELAGFWADKRAQYDKFGADWERREQQGEEKSRHAKVHIGSPFQGVALSIFLV